MNQWRYPFALLGIVFILIGYAFWPKNSLIPVLIYHDISAAKQPTDSYTVERELLARELDHLKTKGYTPLTFAGAQLLREQNKLPNKPIIISFDDALPGQRQVIDLLRERGMSATFFIPSDLVGDTTHMSWDGIRSVAGAGMEIGGHTKNHVHLREMKGEGLTNEIVGDKQHIEAEIGKPITVFAYPYREKSDAADEIVARAGYTIVRDAPAFRSTVMINSFEAFLKAL